MIYRGYCLPLALSRSQVIKIAVVCSCSWWKEAPLVVTPGSFARRCRRAVSTFGASGKFLTPQFFFISFCF